MSEWVKGKTKMVSIINWFIIRKIQSGQLVPTLILKYKFCFRHKTSWLRGTHHSHQPSHCINIVYNIMIIMCLFL